MHYFINAITKHYADFSGRARRKEFWMFVLFSVVAGLIAGVIDGVLGTTFGTATSVLGSLVSLALFLPGLAVTIRRLHDVGKSGWFYLIALVPLVGGIWLLVLFCALTDSVASTHTVRIQRQLRRAPLLHLASVEPVARLELSAVPSAGGAVQRCLSCGCGSRLHRPRYQRAELEKAGALAFLFL